MARVLSGLMVLFLLVTPSASAQSTGPDHVTSLHGLQRILARQWMAPLASEDGTDPDPVDDAAILLSVVIYEFDSPDNAATGWQRIHDAIPQGGGQPLEQIPLDGMGDQAQGYTGDVQLLGQTLAFVFAVVQDGPLVYSMAGELVGLDGAEETRGIVESLLDATPGTGEETYDAGGASSGGLWDILDAVTPSLAPGTTVTDRVLFPMPGMSSPATAPSENEADRVSTVDMHGFGEIDGVESIYGVTYLPDSASDQSRTGAFRIESWLLPFESANQASDAVDRIAETLSGAINVQIRNNQRVSANETIVTNRLVAGPINDASLPAGNGAASIQQIGSTVYAVLVYSTGDNPADVAADITQQMIDTPAGDTPVIIHPDGSVEGGIWARFPQAGDPLLEGLQPSEFTEIDTPEGAAKAHR